LPGWGNIFLQDVSIGQHWIFEVDGVVPNTVVSWITQDILTGELSLAVQWYTWEATQLAYDQINFYSDFPGAVNVPQSVYVGGGTQQYSGGAFQHSLVVSGLPCEYPKKFFFSVQSKNGNKLMGSPILSSPKIQKCFIPSDGNLP
jgi:hypothetical protein